MKRMSELKDNLRGVKCDATKRAFRYLKKQGRKPRVGETPTAYYIRVQIDGQRYDYYAESGSWAVTRRRGADGRWRKVQNAAEFYALALERSAIRNSDEATEKQIAFIDSLLDETGVQESEGARLSKSAANEEIDRLLKVKAAMKYGHIGEAVNPVKPAKPRLSVSDQKAYTSIHRFLSAGQNWTTKLVAFCCDLSEEQACESIARLTRFGLIPFNSREITITNHARIH